MNINYKNYSNNHHSFINNTVTTVTTITMTIMMAKRRRGLTIVTLRVHLRPGR